MDFLEQLSCSGSSSAIVMAATRQSLVHTEPTTHQASAWNVTRVVCSKYICYRITYLQLTFICIITLQELFGFRYSVITHTHFFSRTISASTNTWIHVTMIYRGPNNDQGIEVYQDGVIKASSTMRSSITTAIPSGILKIGRLFNGIIDSNLASISMDELMFFNYQLNQTGIHMIINTF